MLALWAIVLFMISKRSRAAVAAVMAVGGLTVFAADGIRAGFTPDDMMNLYGAWSGSPMDLLLGHRPFGALVYRGLFTLFGLNPLPFRVLCLGLLLANLALLYAFCLRLTNSREVAVLACLLGAYHSRLLDLYYNTGTIYDLAGCFLVLVALVFYFGIRRRGAYPNRRQNAVLVGIYLCALGAKEAAVILPPLIALYEWIYHARRPNAWSDLRWWLARGAIFLYASVAITVCFIVFRTMGAHAMTRNADFAPRLSLHAFMDGWKHYLPDLFYGTVRFNSFRVILLLTLLLALAALLRRRELVFAWCVILVGALPVIFIAPRGFYEMYFALPGWYLYAATLLVLSRDALLRNLPRLAGQFEVRPDQLAMFAALVVLLVPLHRQERPLAGAFAADSERAVRPVLDQLAQQHRPLPRGAKVLFLSDPYPIDEWMLTFILRLYYRDKDIWVVRAKVWPALAEPEARKQFDRLLELDERGLREVPGAR
jgi:hypothetical protein